MHGGGLVMYATPFHFGLAYEMYKAAIASGDDVALAVLAYGECSEYLQVCLGFLMHGRDSKDVSRYPSCS
ncbi:hypothetical protein J3F84DRAFT_378371 [Trichoderma pleuroticola]